jgi:transposase
MGKLVLSARDRQELERIVALPEDARELRRAQAVLWVADGMGVKATAGQLRISRQSIYNWVCRIQNGRGPVRQRLQDAPRSGRPADKMELADQVIPELLKVSPQEKGYRATGWTRRLLMRYLQERYDVDVSRNIVQKAVRRAGYRWKRPRYVLSRRSEHWRQSKGGSSEA